MLYVTDSTPSRACLAVQVKMRTGPADGGATGPVYLMPPEEFLPFMVPFKGGPGPLCGGACSETFQWSVDSDSCAPHITAPACEHAEQYVMQRVARHTLCCSYAGTYVCRESSRTCPTANPDVFALPPAYQSALQSKIQSVSRLRAAVKASFLDSSCKQEVQSVIQAYFKDWLKSSNNIRQVCLPFSCVYACPFLLLLQGDNMHCLIAGV